MASSFFAKITLHLMKGEIYMFQELRTTLINKKREVEDLKRRCYPNMMGAITLGDDELITVCQCIMKELSEIEFSMDRVINIIDSGMPISYMISEILRFNAECDRFEKDCHEKYREFIERNEEL